MSGNAFDPANYPEGVPRVLYSGDRWAFKLSELSAVYPPPTYSLNWTIVQQDETGARHEYTAADDGSGVFVIEILGNDPGGGGSFTGQVAPGDYYWKISAVRTADSEDVTVDQGNLTVRPSLDADGDIRSHTLVTLQNIKAVIQGSASNEQASYSVAGRSLARRSLEELLALEDTFTQRWETEKAELEREAGRVGKSRNVLLRLDA